MTDHFSADPRQSPARRWWVLFGGMVALVAACTFQYGMPFLVPTLRAGGMPLQQAALLVSAPMVGVLCTLIIWGVLADRWGERWVLTGGLAAAAGLLGVAAAVDDPLALGTLLGLAGASAAAVQVASGRLILGWFATHERGLAMGLRQTAHPVGIGLAAATVPVLSPPGRGVGVSLLLMATLCLGAAAVIAVLARDPAPAEVPSHRQAAASLYRGRYLWRIHLASVLLVIPQFGVAAFAFDYLVTVRGVEAGPAAATLALAQAGGGAARLLAGWWSDRVGTRLRPMRLLAGVIAACVLATGLAAAWPTPGVPSGLLLLLVGLSTVMSVSSNGLSYTAVAEWAGRARAGRALGVQNTVQNGVAVLTVPVFAALITMLGDRDGYPVAFLLLTLPALMAVFIVPVRDEPALSLPPGAEAAPEGPAPTRRRTRADLR